jgi:hypothetical protein
MPKKYSELFETLYDEIEPTANVGRGSHYSVFRAQFDPAKQDNMFYDFVVIWDEDHEHDTRIIGVLEELYRSGELNDFVIFGERKGVFSALSVGTQGPAILPSHINISYGDCWSTETIKLSEVDRYSILIQGDAKKAKAYIDSIRQQWSLGKKVLAVDTKATDTAPAKADDKQKFDAAAQDSPAALLGLAQLKLEPKLPVKKVTAQHGSGKQVALYGFPNIQKAQEKELVWQKKSLISFSR